MNFFAVCCLDIITSPSISCKKKRGMALYRNRKIVKREGTDDETQEHKSINRLSCS